MIFFGCSNSEECHNCDEVNNELSIENKKLIQDFDRNEIIKYDADTQKVVFRLLSAKKKKEVWMDKIKHLKSIAVNNEELIFFNKIEEIVESITFQKSWTSEVNIKYQKMLDKAADNFGWSDEYIMYAFGTLDNVVLESSGVLKIDLTVENTDPLPIGNTPDCNCRWGWCPGSDCGTKRCDDTDFGCGFLGLGSCTGLCD